MKIYLIRHGKTSGNLLGRYIGTTDEPLCAEGKEALAAGFPLSDPETVYVSGLLRTKETASLLFPSLPARIRTGFNECDFGRFENKNYKELEGVPEYQAWVDSGGTLPFPGGESRSVFAERCCRAFYLAVGELMEEEAGSAAFVVHGGTIMSILERFGSPKRNFYEWQVKNGQGFSAWLCEEAWKSGDNKLTDIRGVP